MKAVVGVLALCCTGCMFFVTRDVQTTRTVTQEVTLTPIRTFTPRIEVQARDATIRAFISVPRTCQRTLVSHLEVTHGKRLGFEIIGGDDAYAVAFALLGAPLTLPISGLIVAGILTSHKETITQDRRGAPNGIEPCPAIGQRGLDITTPTGVRSTMASRADGLATFEVPADEPDHGIVTLVTTGGEPVRIGYYRTIAACDAERKARLAHANAMTRGRTSVLEAIPKCGLVTTGSEKQTERAWELALGAAVAASRGVCRPAHDNEESVKNLDPQLHGLVWSHPEVSICVQREAERRRSMTSCMLARADAMRSAQQIQDPQQRGQALLRIPKCKPGE